VLCGCVGARQVFSNGKGGEKREPRGGSKNISKGGGEGARSKMTRRVEMSKGKKSAAYTKKSRSGGQKYSFKCVQQGESERNPGDLGRKPQRNRGAA